MINRLCRDIGHYFKKLHFKDKWRKKNKHNFTVAYDVFNIKKVEVGKGTYGSLNVHTYGNNKEKLIIGNFCSISDSVDFILGGNHRYSTITTFPVRNKLIDNENESICKGPIIIKDDVWIGFGCKILSGVEIGQGSIIAAGSVVTRNVEPYAIYGGVPAKLIKMRFNDSIIKKLMTLDYTNVDVDKLIKLNEELDKEINDKNVDKIIKKLME